MKNKNKKRFLRPLRIAIKKQHFVVMSHFQSCFVTFRVATGSHSRMGQYIWSYLLTLEVDLIEFLEVMAQIWQYVIFLSLKPIKVTSDFILN